jgi:hypothetical protein
VLDGSVAGWLSPKHRTFYTRVERESVCECCRNGVATGAKSSGNKRKRKHHARRYGSIDFVIGPAGTMQLMIVDAGMVSNTMCVSRMLTLTRHPFKHNSFGLVPFPQQVQATPTIREHCITLGMDP